MASPIDGRTIGIVREGDEAIARAAMAAAARGLSRRGRQRRCEERAAALERAADLLEHERGALIALLQNEGGKTLDDALAEVREAVDYCRYYAAQARSALAPQPMPGPTGESNALRYRGRGVFVCISPWNFPLAIFLGQVAAALAAGNAVVAKPAEQTPLIAARAVRASARRPACRRARCISLPGDGEVGACLVADARVAGVAFTGSTEVGRAINRALAAKNGPIVPLIAETGGINAMIVDATALARAGDRRRHHVGLPLRRPALFGAAAPLPAGRCRRAACSTCSIGAMRELKVGDPRDASTHVGPVIDAEAKKSSRAGSPRWSSAGRAALPLGAARSAAGRRDLCRCRR